VSRLVDRGAITAAYVGIGMAVTIAISFLLIIPIEPIVWLLSVPSGLLIGYYANQRSNRRAGPWARILVNGLFAALVTGLTAAILLLGVKALFFYADNGYPDFNRVDPKTGVPIPPYCQSGAACVYARYLAVDGGARVSALEAAGVTDAASFGSFYWAQQFSVAGMLVVVTTASGLGGALLYGFTRSKPVTADMPATRTA
jgi:hypothetical protein